MHIEIKYVIASIAIGLFPAMIAKRKGYNFYVWWLYGFLAFLVALIHVSFIKNKIPPEPDDEETPDEAESDEATDAEESGE